MIIGAAQRGLSRNNRVRFPALGVDCVSHADWLRRFCNTVFPTGVHLLYKGDDDLWWLGKVSANSPTDEVYLGRDCLDDPGPVKLPLSQARHTTSTRAVRGSRLEKDLASVLARGVQCNVDESRSHVYLIFASRLHLIYILPFSWTLGIWFCTF